MSKHTKNNNIGDIEEQIRQHVATVLRLCLADRAETRGAAAKAIGIGTSTYDRLSSGQASPGSAVAVRIAAHYGLRVDEVLGQLDDGTIARPPETLGQLRRRSSRP